jgi:hypothetical protein
MEIKNTIPLQLELTAIVSYSTKVFSSCRVGKHATVIYIHFTPVISSTGIIIDTSL